MPGFFLIRPSRRDVPRVLVGSHPWALPRGLERPRYAYCRPTYASSSCRVNARFWCSLSGSKALTQVARTENLP